MIRTSLVWALVSMIGGVAWAQEEPPGDLKIHGQFDRIELGLNSIISQLSGFGGASATIRTDLFTANSILEQNQFALAAMTETSFQIDEDITHVFVPQIAGLVVDIESIIDQCDDTQLSCLGGVAYVSADGNSGAYSCFPYACGDDGCLTRCDGDADCTGGAHCQGHACALYGPSTCDYAAGHEGNSNHLSIVEDPAGQRSDCQPYLCRSGACLMSCTVTNDCAAGFLCDTLLSACVSPPPPTPQGD